jgi:hypothetical protein
MVEAISVVRSAGTVRVALNASAKAMPELPNANRRIHDPSDRFFAATILAGHLHVRGIPDWGPWDPVRLEWKDEAFVDMILSEITGDRKVRTREQLEAVMNEPMGPAPTRYLRMHERLVDGARRLWGAMAVELPGGTPTRPDRRVSRLRQDAGSHDAGLDIAMGTPVSAGLRPVDTHIARRTSLWWAFPISNATIAIVTVLWFLKGDWKKTKLTEEQDFAEAVGRGDLH